MTGKEINGFYEILKRFKEAQQEAIRNGIRANTIVISERLSKTKPFCVISPYGTMHAFPPMILGMEMRVFDDLPDEYDFAILQVQETETERIKQEIANKTKRMIIGGIIGKLESALQEIPLPERATKQRVKRYIRNIINELEDM